LREARQDFIRVRMIGRHQQVEQITMELLRWQSSCPLTPDQLQLADEALDVLLTSNGFALPPFSKRVPAPFTDSLTDGILEVANGSAAGVFDLLEEVGQKVAKVLRIGGHGTPLRAEIPGKKSELSRAIGARLWLPQAEYI